MSLQHGQVWLPWKVQRPTTLPAPLALWRSCFLSLARWKEANQVGWVTFIALIWVWKFNRHLLRLRLRVKYCLLYLLVMMWCMFLFAFFWDFWPLQTQLRSPEQFHQIETETVCHTWSSILSTVSFLIFWMTVRAVCTSRNSNQTKENARLFARWALPVGMCPCWWSWLKLVCDFKLVSNHKLSTCNIRECAVSECDPSPRTKAWTSRAWTFLMAIMRHCERTRHEEVMTRRADCCRATGRLWSGSGRCTAGGWKKWEKWKEHCNYVQFYKYEWYHHIIIMVMTWMNEHERHRAVKTLVKKYRIISDLKTHNAFFGHRCCPSQYKNTHTLCCQAGL